MSAKFLSIGHSRNLMHVKFLNIGHSRNLMIAKSKNHIAFKMEVLCVDMAKSSRSYQFDAVNT